MDFKRVVDTIVLSFFNNYSVGNLDSPSLL